MSNQGKKNIIDKIAKIRMKNVYELIHNFIYKQLNDIEIVLKDLTHH